MHAWGAASPRGLGRGATGAARRGHMGGSVFVAGIRSRRVSAAVQLRREPETPEGQGRIDSTYEPPGRGHLRVVGDGMPGEATNHLARRLVQACIFGVAMWHMLRASPRRE